MDILRKDKSKFLRKALDFTVKETNKKGSRKKTWIQRVIEQSRKAWLKESNANNQSEVNIISGKMM